MDDFMRGVYYFFLGARYLFTNGLKRFIILPILFNFLLFAGIFYAIYHYLFPYSQYYVNQLPAWLSFLSTVLLILFIISFFLLFLSMFTVMFNLIAAPFNGLLAEKTQNILYNSVLPSLSFSEIAVRSIKRQGQFLAYFIPRFIGVCVLFFIPFIHPFYPFIWFFFNAWMLSVQYQDFAMDNNLLNFNEMQQKISQTRFLSLGFGSVINTASFIPIVNLFTMPAAVIGSVLMFCDLHKPNLRPIASYADQRNRLITKE